MSDTVRRANRIPIGDGSLLSGTGESPKQLHFDVLSTADLAPFPLTLGSQAAGDMGEIRTF